jgi:hypothetical protein
VSHRTRKQNPQSASRKMCATLAATILLTASALAAQTQAAPPLTDSSPPAHVIHKKKVAPRGIALDRIPAPEPPPHPDWPINDHPAAAAVAWNSPALRIDAANSSLQQILTDISSATGAEVEGLAKDERVFGSFGPGPARDVISQILQGTGYNIVMVGDQGGGVPRQIILSARNTSKIQTPSRPTAEEPEDEAPDYPQPEPQPQAQPPQPNQQPVRPGFPPDGAVPGRLPQQYPQQAPQPQTQPQQNAPQNQ